MIRRLEKMITGVVKVAKAISTDDSKLFRFSQISALGKTQTANDLTPYGLIHNPPRDSMAVVLVSQGNESTSFAIIDDPNRRPKDLVEGEAGIANYLTGTVFIMKANGDWDITVNGNVNLNCTGSTVVESGGAVDVTSGGLSSIHAPEIFLDAPIVRTQNGRFDNSGLSITGGDVTADTVSLKSHVHSGVESGTDETGTPVA